MQEIIRVQQRGPLVEVILNQPDNRNAFNVALVDALAAAFAQVEKLDGARVVLLRGEGRGFSAGLDLAGFDQTIERFGPQWADNLFPLTAAWQDAFNRVERCSLPVIALLHGYCIGAGMELALACDFRIAAEETKLSLPETRLGLIPDVGGTVRLTRLIGPARAKEIILTGRTVEPQTALDWGMICDLVPADSLLERGRKLAEELIAAAPLAVSYAKRVINDISDLGPGLRLEAWAQSSLMRTRDFQIGVQALLARQQPEWTGK